MELWIRSQDRNYFGKVENFWIEEVSGGWGIVEPHGRILMRGNLDECKDALKEVMLLTSVGVRTKNNQIFIDMDLFMGKVEE